MIELLVKNFGEVDHVRYRSNDTYHYFDVQFKSLADCAKLLAAKLDFRLCLTKDLFQRPPRIIAADIRDQPDYNPNPFHPLVKPPEQDSPNQILNALNDDCLCEVFRFLPLIDLNNAAEVCVRFNALAKEVFSSKFKNTFITRSPCSNIGIFELTKDTAGKLLASFGSLMQSLYMGWLGCLSDGTVVKRCANCLSIIFA